MSSSVSQVRIAITESMSSGGVLFITNELSRIIDGRNNSGILISSDSYNLEVFSWKGSEAHRFAYMSNTGNLYPIDKSTLPTVRFVPSDSCYLPSDNILPMANCCAIQEVRNTIYIPY